MNDKTQADAAAISDICDHCHENEIVPGNDFCADCKAEYENSDE